MIADVHGRQNPWRAWFAAVDLRKTIQQDVERTCVDPILVRGELSLPARRFPDMGYFRNEDIQHQLTNVLFLYCEMHPDIGYRQGMHELLAPLFYAVGKSSVVELQKGLPPFPYPFPVCSSVPYSKLKHK